jgi:hypothetical protein
MNNPEYYKRGEFEAIDVIEALGYSEGFCMGEIIKIAFRLGAERPMLDDLKIMQYYINRYISYLENGIPGV